MRISDWSSDVCSSDLVTLTGDGARGDVSLRRDVSLYVALAMAAFAMLFGTRRASAVEHNRGLVLAIAFESMFKLVAMLALGAFVWFEIGRASWRERVCKYVYISVVAGSLKKKQ